MSNKSKNSNRSGSTFLDHLEKGVQSILDESLIELENDKRYIRSRLKQHVQLIIYTKLDRIIEKLIP